MADKDIHLAENNLYKNQDDVPLKMVDNGDGTYSLAVIDVTVDPANVRTGGVPLDVDRTLRIEGANSDINNTGSWQDLTEAPLNPDGTVVEPDPSGETLVIKSNNVNDTAGGTGAQEVRVLYLTLSDTIVEVSIPTNGGTVVTLITDFASVEDFYVSKVGTNKTAVGDVDIIDLADTKIYNVIKAGGNKSESSFRNLASASAFYITSYVASSLTRGIKIQLRMTANDSGEVFPDVYLYQVPLTLGDDAIPIALVPAIFVPGGAKIKVSARTTEAGTHEASVMLNGYVKV